MKTSRKQEAASTALVVLIILGVILAVEGVVLFARWNTIKGLRESNVARTQELLKEEAEIYTLSTFRGQIDAAWVRMRESYVRPTVGLPAGFAGRQPGRESLPLQVGSFDAAGFTIVAQSEPGVYDAGNEKLEWHRLLPLLNQFETSFVFVQADEMRFTLPPAAAFFSPSPTAVEFRARLRFPVERKPKPAAPASGAATASATVPET